MMTNDRTSQGDSARMRAALDRAVTLAPAFLAGKIDADRMTHTMVAAAREGLQAGTDVAPGPLQDALGELMACGSGYRAGRCDAACVARTMRWMSEQFPPQD